VATTQHRARRIAGHFEVIATHTEIFEFATRLSESDAGSEEIVIAVELHGLNDRRLFAENPARSPFRRYSAQIPSFGWEEMYRRERLITEGCELAVTKARDIFLRFGLEMDLGIVRDIQQETRRV
jgi:hypothetical protein